MSLLTLQENIKEISSSVFLNKIYTALLKKKIPTCFVNVTGRLPGGGWEGLGGARLLLRAERSPRLGLGCGSSPGLSLKSVTAEWGFLGGDHCLHASHKDLPCTSGWSAAGRGAQGSVTLAAPGGPPGLRKSGPNEGIAGAKCKTGGVMVAAGDTQFSRDSLELGLSLSQTLWDQRV